jgi:hypothetical protein
VRGSAGWLFGLLGRSAVRVLGARLSGIDLTEPLRDQVHDLDH